MSSPSCLRVAVEVGALQLRLVREQQIVHLPELALTGGLDRGFVRERRVGVVRRRAVLEDDLHVLRERVADLLQRRLGRRRSSQGKSAKTSRMTWRVGRAADRQAGAV